MLYKQRYVQSCSTSTCGRSLSVARRSFHAITSAAMTARKAAVTVVTCKASKSRPGVKQSPARSCGFGAHILSSRVSRRQGYSCSSSNMRMSDPASKPNILPTEGEGPTDQVSVISRDGKLYPVPFSPGITTVGDLRAVVAEHMSAAPETVRLAYQGQELLVSKDSKVFEKRHEADVMHAMRKDVTIAPPPPSLSANYISTTVPQASVSDVLKVYTMEGKVLSMSVRPGVTTVGDIRKRVATAMVAAASEIRLQYAGKELDPAHDAKPLNLMTLAKSTQKEYIMHAMTRMKGGRPTMNHSSSNDQPVVGNTVKNAKHCGKSFSNTTNSRLSGSSVTSSTRQLPLSLQCSSIITSHAAPGAGRGPRGLCRAQLAEAQLAKQFRDLMKHPIPGVSVAPDEEDTMKWHARLAGPEGTPYSGGWFHLELTFTDRFPGCAPDMKFKTKIWHPNIREVDGRVCLDVGVDARSVGCLLAAVQLLLAHPNTESTLNMYCAREMREQPLEYWEKASKMTELFAMNVVN